MNEQSIAEPAPQRGAHSQTSISSLVITLETDAYRRRLALARLAADPALTLGPISSDRVPVVLETTTLDESRDRVEALMRAPGIRFVDLVCVRFEEC